MVLQGICTFIPQAGEPRALAQVFKIKALIYTAVAPAFPGHGIGIRRKIRKLGQLSLSDPCRRQADCKEEACCLGKEGGVQISNTWGSSSDLDYLTTTHFCGSYGRVHRLI